MKQVLHIKSGEHGTIAGEDTHIFDIDGNITSYNVPVYMLDPQTHKINSIQRSEVEKNMKQGWSIVGDNDQRKYIASTDTGPEGENAFPNYITKCIQNHALGKAHKDLIDTVSKADAISTLTARGHSSQNIQKGISELILQTFNRNNQDTVKTTIENIKKKGRLKTLPNNRDAKRIVKYYLDQQEHIGINSEELIKNNFLNDYKTGIWLENNKLLFSANEAKKGAIMPQLIINFSESVKRRLGEKPINTSFSSDSLGEVNAILHWGRKNIAFLSDMNVTDLYTTYNHNSHL